MIFIDASDLLVHQQELIGLAAVVYLMIVKLALMASSKKTIYHIYICGFLVQ